MEGGRPISDTTLSFGLLRWQAAKDVCDAHAPFPTQVGTSLLSPRADGLGRTGSHHTFSLRYASLLLFFYVTPGNTPNNGRHRLQFYC